MSGRFVRASSYRHVHGTAARAEGEFTEVRATTTGDGNFIAANEKFFCYAGIGGGGPVVVHPLNKPGRFGATVPTLSVHKEVVLDFEFSPFINTLLGTASEDGLVKISAIPEEGLKSNITESLVSLEGHERKVNILHFHPTANNILATASADLSLRVWDIEKQAQVLINNDFGDVIQSFDWNPDGSLLCATAKDGQIRVYDPRNADAALKGPSFSGTKGSRALWMGDKGKIIAVGASKQSARQYAVWDARALQKPLTMVDIDTSAGVLIPYYDPDNSILYCAGKGDGNIRYFEIVDTEPYVHFLSEYRDNQSQKGICFLPKKAVDVTKCEIAVALRLLRDRVVPVSFQVPRKSDMFQKDLYPDSYAGIPSISADEWLGGANKPPKKISMKPGDNKSVSSGSAPAQVTLKPQKSAAQLESELEAANRKIAELEQQVAKLKAGN